MRNYEIRISKSKFRPSIIWASPHPSAYSALCRARELANNGLTLEVWRDDECVHREVVCRKEPLVSEADSTA
jgi:hypothetical protein